MSDLDTSTEITTWGSDVVAILNDGADLVDGGTVKLVDPPSNPDVDTLDLTLELTDVVEEEDPNDFNVSILWNDEQVSTGTLEWRPGEGTRFTAEAKVALPRKLDPGEKFDLEIRGELPAAGGAPTLWRYKDLTVAGSDWCSRLTDAEASSALGIAVAKFDTGGAGGFFDAFCGWRTPDETSQLTMLVTGGGDSFRSNYASSASLVDGFGDVAVYDPTTGRGDDCSSITDRNSGVLQWVCFVNLNVAAGNSVLRFTMSGNVVGNNGPGGALQLLRDVVSSVQ
ncbi:hypothetical protein [Cryobacterium psychrophilum]|uniref:Uncharacterized protein n=1 Tax=Cryobacterium psychrophilum TaxID=41988 RepID=A0A4Y8KT72_9MICO|nr:hypothetical protein [Cryobacterium psychrophilum]TDW28764.1 hypothetical protein EDD25_0396 [Cryobacterium psychrophilum]TFD82416.1 hypothetical protein E3T53_00655 [Cryobacterium psychrophilum]